MRIPKYWAMGSAQGTDESGGTFAFDCWGWSDVSENDARQKGQARAEDVLKRKLAGRELDRYPYGELPMREEVVETVRGRGGEDVAVITRNSYGALVLNAANAMFIDVDFKPEPFMERLTGAVKGLFGKGRQTREQNALQAVRDWAGRRRDLDIRCYRTFAGLRCLITNQTFDPGRESTLELMREVDSDPLYVRLCEKQQCFRARLSPKPWRIKMQKPPAWSPYRSPDDARSFDEWQSQYNRTAPQYAVCRLLEEIGDRRVHRDIEQIISIHDRHCLTGEDLPLA